MRDSKTPTRLAKALLRAARLETGAIKPATTVPKNAERMRGRHAAITNKFNNWRSYREWAEKIRWHVGRKKVGRSGLGPLIRLCFVSIEIKRSWHFQAVSPILVLSVKDAPRSSP